jgi:hypothetical protein
MEDKRKLGEWSVTQLIKFLESQKEQSPFQKASAITCGDIRVQKTLFVQDQIQLTQFQTTVGATGTASALPANPAGYFRVLDHTGRVKLVPFYNA